MTDRDSLTAIYFFDTLNFAWTNQLEKLFPNPSEEIIP